MKAPLAKPRVDIIGPGDLGYGVFTAAKTHIEKDQYIAEYVGEVRPLNVDSFYGFEVPNKCTIDAEKAGNWTRFINSSCKPNVKPWAHTIGKRHVILFQALKDIGPGEELLFNYGRKYFEKAGFLCKCDARDEAHLPGGGKKGGQASA
jgi:SET domain-containing protein